MRGREWLMNVPPKGAPEHENYSTDWCKRGIPQPQARRSQGRKNQTGWSLSRGTCKCKHACRPYLAQQMQKQKQRLSNPHMQVTHRPSPCNSRSHLAKIKGGCLQAWTNQSHDWTQRSHRARGEDGVAPQQDKSPPDEEWCPWTGAPSSANKTRIPAT